MTRAGFKSGTQSLSLNTKWSNTQTETRDAGSITTLVWWGDEPYFTQRRNQHELRRIHLRHHDAPGLRLRHDFHAEIGQFLERRRSGIGQVDLHQDLAGDRRVAELGADLPGHAR